jgi:hypothetical protein
MILEAVLLLPAPRLGNMTHFSDMAGSREQCERMGVMFHIASSLLRDSSIGVPDNVCKRRANFQTPEPYAFRPEAPRQLELNALSKRQKQVYQSTRIGDGAARDHVLKVLFPIQF